MPRVTELETPNYPTCRKFRVECPGLPHDVLLLDDLPQLGSTREGWRTEEVRITPLELPDVWIVETHQRQSGYQPDGSFVLCPEAVKQLERVMLMRGVQIDPYGSVFAEVDNLADIILEKQGIEFGEYT